LILGLLSCETDSKPSNSQSDNPYEEKVDSIIAMMTLEEKLGQLNLPSSGDITTGASKSSNVAKNIAEGKVGGLFNIKTVEKIREVRKSPWKRAG